MFGQQGNQPYVPIGTTSPIFVPRGPEAKIVRPGEAYFFVQIKSAQAAFTGRFWENVKSLIVTSQVNLNHALLGNEPVRAIQRSIAVKKDHAEQLGISPNLVKLVPATMPQVSISIEFILDKENRLEALSGLINEDAFLSALSLAPGAVAVARTIGTLSQKVLQTFLKADEREPILQFGGDLNIAAGLQDGYYVVLGTRDNRNPLPSPLPKMEVRDGTLMADDKPVTQLSYVLLDVRCLGARTRDLNDGAAWDAKLRQAEAVVARVAGNPLARPEQRNQAWEECLSLLQEAQLLLLADSNYLRREAQDIIKAAYALCYKQAFGQEASRSALAIPKGAEVQQPDLRASRSMLKIPQDENIEQSLDRYAEQVVETRRALKAAGIT